MPLIALRLTEAQNKAEPVFADQGAILSNRYDSVSKKPKCSPSKLSISPWRMLLVTPGRVFVVPGECTWPQTCLSPGWYHDTVEQRWALNKVQIDFARSTHCCTMPRRPYHTNCRGNRPTRCWNHKAWSERDDGEICGR